MSEAFNQSLTPQTTSISGSFILPAWATESIGILRLVISDFDPPYKYTDDRLMKLLLASAQLMQSELSFLQPYTIDVTTSLLIPDPTSTLPRDDGFLNLMVLKAACLLAGSGIIRGSEQAIDITDNKSRINLTKKLDGVIATIKNFCDAYNTAKFQYQYRSGIAGQAVLGPYRIFLGENPGFYFSDRKIRGLYY